MKPDKWHSLHYWGFEVLDEGEEGVDVDGFGDEGEIADGQGALAVFFAGVAGDGDGGDVAQAGQEAQLFEQLIAVGFGHADVGNDDVRAFHNRTLQRLRS